MHKKTQVFVFDFQKHYEFMTFMAEGCIRGSIYDKFTINLQYMRISGSGRNVKNT